MKCTITVPIIGYYPIINILINTWLTYDYERFVTNNDQWQPDALKIYCGVLLIQISKKKIIIGMH